jgi:hypothetical protein
MKKIGSNWKKDRMRKFVFGLMVLFFISSCGSKNEEVERIMEDGVEVVINHLEPYEIKGEADELYLEEILTIDMEKDEIAELGLADSHTFDVDSEGNIFLYQYPREGEHLVFKFNKAGDFLKSFGDIGQGPGEIQLPGYLKMTSSDEIPIIDRTAKKLMYFDTNGVFLKEIRFDLIYRPYKGFDLLENGNFLIHRLSLGPSGEIQKLTISIFDPGFNKIKDLIDYDFPGLMGGKTSVFGELPVVGISKSKIFLGYENTGKDILVYDLNGKLERKIRKEYSPVSVPNELKLEIEEIKEKLKDIPIWDQIYIPSHMPLFQYFFTDDGGRLYVLTSEKDKSLGTNICDIYNPEGVFIGRKSMGYFDLLKSFYLTQPLDTIAKGGRLYCLREKESGYKELVVYKMNWE